MSEQTQIRLDFIARALDEFREAAADIKRISRDGLLRDIGIAQAACTFVHTLLELENMETTTESEDA